MGDVADMPSAGRRPSAPTGLKASGRKLWRDIVALYDLRPDQLRVLADACREVDVVDRLAKQVDALDDSELTVLGSQKQEVMNPLVKELGTRRALVARLLQHLRLEDDADGAAGGRSHAARQMNRARWG